MEDTLAFNNPQTSWVAYVTQRDATRFQNQKRASDNQEVVVDKSELKSEVNALLNSVAVAIARLESKSHGKSVRISEFEMVQADAQRILSVLSEPGSIHQLGELSRQEAAVRSTFLLEADKSHHKNPSPYDDDDDDDDSPSMGGASASGSSGDAGPTIHKRRGRLHHAIGNHVAIRQDAASLADDSKTDLLAALAVASAVYGGYEYKEILEKRKAEIVATGASEAVTAERIDLIEHEGKNICSSMGKEATQTNACVVDAAEKIGDLHIKQHKDQCSSHLKEARACLAEYNDPHLLAEFDRNTKDWERQIDVAAADFKSNLKETRGSLPELTRLASAKVPVTTQDGLLSTIPSTGLTGAFEKLNRHAFETEKPLEMQSAILDKPWKALLVAEAELAGMKAGEYNVDVGAIAHAAGTSKHKIYEEVAAYQKENHVPIESPEELNRRIESINEKWKSQVHDPRHGTAVNINIVL